ncbi:STAS-like domain-containing protein [Pseudomonas solani]|uniref:STAS-like domain-containing protein n=1 Tax=Pseudomonas solani TaxID=2731552 RepID=UPI0035BE9BBF
MKHIDIAKDFSRHPAGRFRSDGPYSGELFRVKFLEPAISKNEAIEVSFDGARGYGSSFLEEAFGGLVRKGFPAEVLMRLIRLRSSNSVLIEQILKYIRESKPESTRKNIS